MEKKFERNGGQNEKQVILVTNLKSGDWRGSGFESLMNDLVVCVGLTSIPQPVLHNRLPEMRNGLVP